jgi:tetratricopeptide (TPR) repeat protein
LFDHSNLLVRIRAHRPSLIIAVTLLLQVAAVHWFESYFLEGDKQRTHAHAKNKIALEVDARFKQGVLMLHSKQYEHALTAFHRVLELRPTMPEAHVNIGFAFLGLEKNKEARDFFQSAQALRPQQANAYYGAAIASFSMGDRREAIHAMYQFLTLSSEADPYRAKAEALLEAWRNDIPIRKDGLKPDSAKAHSNAHREPSRKP